MKINGLNVNIGMSEDGSPMASLVCAHGTILVGGLCRKLLGDGAIAFIISVKKADDVTKLDEVINEIFKQKSVIPENLTIYLCGGQEGEVKEIVKRVHVWTEKSLLSFTLNSQHLPFKTYHRFNNKEDIGFTINAKTENVLEYCNRQGFVREKPVSQFTVHPLVLQRNRKIEEKVEKERSNKITKQNKTVDRDRTKKILDKILSESMDDLFQGLEICDLIEKTKKLDLTNEKHE